MLLNSSSLLAQWFTGYTGREQPEVLPHAKRLVLFSLFALLVLPFSWGAHRLLEPVFDELLAIICQLCYLAFGYDFAFDTQKSDLLLQSRRPNFEALLGVRSITANTPVFWALLLAAPGLRLANRLRKLAIGTGLLIASQALFVIVKVESTLVAASHPDAGNALMWTTLDNLFEVSGKGFFPIAIWLWLTLPYLMGEVDRRDVAPGKRVGRNDPCPCGSGKKYKKCCAGTP